MSSPGKHLIAFDDFLIDVEERILKRGDELVPLTQKSFEILFLLVKRQGTVVSKETLLETVWPETYVEESNLTQNIYTLRKALGPRPDGEAYIVTVPRRGYSFTAPVHEKPAGEKQARQTTPAVEILPAAIAPLAPAHVSDMNGPPVVRVATSGVRFGNHARMLMAGAGLFLVLGAWWVWFRRPAAPAATDQMRVRALTTSGNVTAAAISPDGKYVAYATMDAAGQSSLWLEEPATAARTAILPPGPLRYFAISFSPSGSYIYYVTEPGRTLYRVPTLGGPPRLIREQVETAVSFSPDGARYAFRRSPPERRVSALFTASADGGDEREIAVAPYPQILHDPAWSPDGARIACAVGDNKGAADMYPAVTAATGGPLRRLTTEGWRWIGQMAWLKNGRELLMVAQRDTARPRQIWRLDTNTGVAREVTSDAGAYSRLSLASAGHAMVALQVRQLSNVWMMPAAAPAGLRQITSGAGGYRGGVSWTPDGRLVYDAEAGGASAISIMDADGANPRLLSADMTGRAYLHGATVTPDGRYVVFVSDLGGTHHLWRMNVDGTSLVQLTRGSGEGDPHCSPDGRWVVYTIYEHEGTDRPTLGRVSIDGGETAQLTKAFTAYPAVSPDGQSIASLYAAGPGAHPWQIAIFPFAGGEPRVIFPQTVSPQNLRWTHDGRYITYGHNPPAGAATLWQQPREGGAPRLLLTAETARFFGWDWSPDGQRLALVRGLWETNVVLLTGVH
ncbi:MAG: winged helix-turn-helix domain-containing protein [Blastocatellia bacterium]